LIFFFSLQAFMSNNPPRTTGDSETSSSIDSTPEGAQPDTAPSPTTETLLQQILLGLTALEQGQDRLENILLGLTALEQGQDRLEKRTGILLQGQDRLEKIIGILGEEKKV
jgi:hypothetical protein